MKWHPMSTQERDRVEQALRGNAQEGLALLTGKDTSFLGARAVGPDMPELTDDEVIGAIKSVPCHY